MPQIWVTYEELADYYGIAPEEAQKAVYTSLWARRRSRDGLTRVKLPADVALKYMTVYISQVAISSACSPRTLTIATQAITQFSQTIGEPINRAA